MLIKSVPLLVWIEMQQPDGNVRSRSLGSIIRARRLALGLTPREFADEIGRSELAVARIEHDEIKVDGALLKRCEQVLLTKLADYTAGTS